jgi:hypothetical protein
VVDHGRQGSSVARWLGYRARVTELLKRRLALPLALVLVLAVVFGASWGIRIATAPDVAEICEHVLALARAGGEQLDEADAALCLEVMQDRRERAGRDGWARLSRCIANTRSLDEAGRCKP